MKIELYFVKLCSPILAAFILASCGSGGTSAPTSNAPDNQGQNQQVDPMPVEDNIVDMDSQSSSSSVSSQVLASSSSSLSSANPSSDASSSQSSVLPNISSQTFSISSSSQVSSSVSSTSSVVQSSSSSSQVSNLTLVQGNITYDRVPFDGRSYKGLDYSNVERFPARGIAVQLLSSSNNVLAATTTDGDGHYSFQTNKNTDVRVRVLAQTNGESAAQWDVQVRDNTNGSALYVLDGSLANTGSGTGQIRDLHATSGWDGDAYTGARSAGPFAILDSIYDAIQLVVSAEANIVLPPLDIYWSTNNIAINGNLSDGYIGTSFYTSAGPSIYLLGAENNDSDEYDRAVVQHEFGHYLEHQLGRTESLGGSHSIYSTLDMRVAFGEAWGNAFAGMASGDPIYRDSLGSKQSLGFAIDVESTGFGKQGWFSEGSVQNILYDIFDSNDDDSDRVSLGFKAVYDVLTDDAYLDFEGFASIYAFASLLKQQQPQAASAINDLLQGFDIYGDGWYGEGETNNAGSAHVLPVYRELSPGQSISVCSDSDFQEYNGVDVRRFIRIDLPEDRNYTIEASKNNSGGLARTNPQLRLSQKGFGYASSYSSTRDFDSISRSLRSGTYILEVYEEANSDGDDSTGGLACFDVSVY